MLEVIVGFAVSLVLLLLGWIKSDTVKLRDKVDAHIEAHAKGEFKGGLKKPDTLYGPRGY